MFAMTSSVVPRWNWRICPSVVLATLALITPLPVNFSPKKQSGVSAMAQIGIMSAVVLVPL